MSAPSLKIGMVGLGRIGRRHAEQLAFRTRHCTVTAVCSAADEDAAWAASELGLPHTYRDYDQFLKESGVDAVVISTPTTLHAAQTMAALRAGKHVFVEKPLSMDAAECEQVEAVAREHPKQIAMVGFVRRFDASYANAYAAVQRGDIGKPFIVRSQTCDKNDPAGYFVRYAPTSGGIFMDCSVHDIDLARWMLGSPKALRVFATGTIVLHPGLADCGDVDNGVAVIEFEGGAKAVIYASHTFAHGHETSTEIIGTAGNLLVGAGAARDRMVTSDASGVRHVAVEDFWERFADAFGREMNAFVAACLGQAPVPLSLSDATEATRIASALTRSLQSGKLETV
jgi:myo-inositol 2-dehydrogenase / D-chiro-inositol 1-dehydrogenase